MTKKAELKKLEKMLFTDQTITIDGNKFKVPRCQICKQPMTPTVDSISGKLTGYTWKCECPIGKKYRLGIG